MTSAVSGGVSRSVRRSPLMRNTGGNPALRCTSEAPSCRAAPRTWSRIWFMAPIVPQHATISLAYERRAALPPLQDRAPRSGHVLCLLWPAHRGLDGGQGLHARPGRGQAARRRRGDAADGADPVAVAGGGDLGQEGQEGQSAVAAA